jgi:DNA repair exonuclease SbcCD ATPase subunit
MTMPASGTSSALEALEALGSAIVEAARTLDGVGDSTEALELVMGLGETLTGLPQLADALSRLLRTALPGPDVEMRLAAALEQIASARAGLGFTQQRLTLLAARENELRELARQHADVQARLSELTALEAAVASLPQLTRQQETLARRAETMRAQSLAAESALAATAEEVVSLSDERLAGLSEQTRVLLERIRASEAAYAAQLQRHADCLQALEEAGNRYDALAGLPDDLQALTPYLEADRALVAAFADLGGQPELVVDGVVARVRLERLHDQLAGVDAALKRALIEREKADKIARRVLRYGERRSEPAAS